MFVKVLNFFLQANTVSNSTQSTSSNNLGGLLSGVSQNATSAANDLAPAVVALLARQVGLNLSNNAALNSVAGALAGNLPLGGAASGGNMNLSNSGLNMTSNLGGIGGMNLPNTGLNLGSGLGNNLSSASLGSGMGSQGSMNSFNMGPGLGMGSGINMATGSGMMALNTTSGMDNMGQRSSGNLASFNHGIGNYGSSGSMGMSGRGGNDGSGASVARGGMSGNSARSSDTILIRNLPIDCNWQVKKYNGIRKAIVTDSFRKIFLTSCALNF